MELTLCFTIFSDELRVQNDIYFRFSENFMMEHEHERLMSDMISYLQGFRKASSVISRRSFSIINTLVLTSKDSDLRCKLLFFVTLSKAAERSVKNIFCFRDHFMQQQEKG